MKIQRAPESTDLEAYRPESRPRRRLSALFVDSSDSSGSEEWRRLELTCLYLKERGHRVHRLTLKGASAAPEGSGPLRRWLRLDQAAEVWRLRRVIARGGYDVVCGQGDQALLALRWAMAGMKRAPALVAERPARQALPASLAAWAAMRSSRLSHAIVLTRRDRAALIAKGLGADRVSVVTAGVDADQYRPVNTYEEARTAIGVAPEAPLVCALGDLRAENGHNVFLIAFALTRQRLPTAKAVVVGHGDKTAFAHALEQLGILHHVQFVEPGAATRHFVSASDVAVCVADDGTGAPVARAMACARPMVTLAGADPMELVQHGCTGFVVPDKDARGLASAIVWMIQNPLASERIALQGRERVERTFSEQARAFQVERVLLKAVENPNN